MEPNILVTDVETTNIDPITGSIISIGATWLKGGNGEKFNIENRMWEGAEWTEGAYTVNGRDLDSCKDQTLVTEADAIFAFLDYLSGHTPLIIAGMNPRFDRDFLINAGKRAGVNCESTFSYRTLDMHSACIGYILSNQIPYDIPATGMSTDTIYEFLGLEPEPKPHKAITGAIREKEAFEILLGIQTTS